MRWLVMPVVSCRNIRAAPSYAFFKAFRHFALERSPDDVFYVVVPRLGDGNRWQEGADWGGPRTHVIETDMYESQFDDLLLVTRDFWERFNERWGDLYFDVLLTEKPALAPILKRLVSFHLRSKTRGPLVVCRDQFTIDRKWNKVDVGDEILQAAGWATCPTIFQSPHQAKRAVAIARQHLTPSHLRKMAETMQVFPLGIDCADVDLTNMTERDAKNERLTVNYSHKLFREQMFLESLAIMDSTFASGRNIELQVVTGSSSSKFSMMKAAQKYRWMTCFGGMGRAEFLRQMAKAHVFISNSWYEDFSATVAEQIYTGLVPVLFRADWSTYLVGPEYPYLFRSMDEGQAMLRYVVDNYEAVSAEWVPQLQAKMREEFDLASITPRMIDWIRGLHEEHQASRKSRPGLEALLDDAFDVLPAEFGLPEVYAAIAQKSRGLDVRKQSSESMATSAWLCVEILLRRHPELVDLGTELPRWKKGGA